MKTSAKVAIFFAVASAASAQMNVVSIAPPAKLTAKAGASVQAKLTVQVRQGYHANSNTPSDDYLIPLKLTWNPGPLAASGVAYPKPSMEKYSFSDKPLSVFTGDFDIVTTFKTSPTAAIGPAVLAGKLRYQACNDRMCLPPKTIDVTLPVEITK